MPEELNRAVKIKQYRPSFFEGFKPEELEVKTLKELMEIEWIKSWELDDWFYRFSISQPYAQLYPNNYLLMAEFDFGKVWWIVCYLEGDAGHEIFKYLPRWEAPTTK